MQTVTNPSRSYNPVAHMLSGAISGGVAAAITTPLDVCKTFLNTQQSQVSVDFFKIIYELFDVFLFFEKYNSFPIIYNLWKSPLSYEIMAIISYLLPA